MTNGMGMMRFSRGFMRFGRGLPVVPLALRARPAFGISSHTLTSSFLANLFWFSFCPWVELDATVLPALYPDEVCPCALYLTRWARVPCTLPCTLPCAAYPCGLRPRLARRPPLVIEYASRGTRPSCAASGLRL